MLIFIKLNAYFLDGNNKGPTHKKLNHSPKTEVRNSKIRHRDYFHSKVLKIDGAFRL